jgi:hypothetical protein
MRELEFSKQQDFDLHGEMVERKFGGADQLIPLFRSAFDRENLPSFLGSWMLSRLILHHRVCLPMRSSCGAARRFQSFPVSTWIKNPRSSASNLPF